MSIGNRIKKRRQELGLSVDDMAAKLNKNRATIYRYESEEIENLPLNILEPLAKALRVTPIYLMGWEQKTDDDELSKDAKIIGRKYDKLDNRGKHTVETVVEMEYNRIHKSYLVPVAAHNDDESDEQLKLMQQDIDEL